MFFFFKQKTAYGVRISDWSSDVCSADLEREGKARIEGKAETDVGRYRITRIDAPDKHVDDHFIHVARDVIEIGDPAIDHRGVRRHQDVDPRLDRPEDRKRVVSGKSESVRVDLGGRRDIKKQKHIQTN